MRRVLEVVFGHPRKLLLLLLLPPLLGLLVVFLLPRTYQASATLWALRRYEIIGATGPESDLNASPASTQATALMELLQTRSFALAVASDSHLAAMLDARTRANAQTRDDALYKEVSQQVQITDQGYNLLVVSYSNRDPHLAQRVVDAITRHYSTQSYQFSIAEGQRLLASYQADVVQAKRDAQSATQAVAQYVQTHPGLTPLNVSLDPQYALLVAEAQQAQTTLMNEQASVTTITQEITAIATGSGGLDQGLFMTVDPARVSNLPDSRVKSFLLGGGIGLGIALLACAAYIVLLLRLDATIHTPAELRGLTTLPVVLQVPRLPTPFAPLSVAVRSFTVKRDGRPLLGISGPDARVR
jgi:uncharacterized protein involved in exopolysaccharide biosynthesis